MLMPIMIIRQGLLVISQKVVMNLIKAGWLNFKEDNPNIWSNSLLGHRGPSVNAIEEGVAQPMRLRPGDVKPY